MKNLLVVLSAAVVAALVVYALFGRAFAVLGNSVHMPIDTLVWLFAVLSIVAAATTLVLHTALQRSERSVLARLAELEKTRSN